MLRAVSYIPGILMLLPVPAIAVCAILFSRYGKPAWGAVHKGRVLLATAVGIPVFGIYCLSGHLTRIPTLTIRYTYKEISDGQNPNGTRFNPSGLVSEDTIGAALEELGCSVDAGDVAGCLQTHTDYDDGTVDAEDDLKVATEYRVTFSRDILSYGVDPAALLSAIGEIYKESFLDEYTDNTDILEVTDVDSGVDYPEMKDELLLQAKELKHYMDTYGYEDANFREDGTSFPDLAEEVQTFIDVDLERFNSYVLEHGLSKEAGKYKKWIDYKNRMKEVDKDKMYASYKTRLEAISMYAEDMATVVLVPTRDEDDEFYMSRTKIGVDYFAEEASEYSEQAASIQEGIDTNTYAKEQVLGSTAGSSEYAKAEEMLAQLEEDLSSLADECRELSEAYQEYKSDGYVDISTSAGSADIKGGAACAGACAVSAAAVCCLWSAYRDTERRRKS